MRRLIAVLVLSLVSSLAVGAQAPAKQATGESKATWYFYTVKWGFQDEFVDLFRRNHYPVLKEHITSGRFVDVQTYVPTYHGDGRADWTFAVVITYRDAAAMTSPSGDEEIQRRLYPDRTKFLKEEQRRFEILEAHWDVPLNRLDLDRP
jgi:hypothetical protein